MNFNKRKKLRTMILIFFGILFCVGGSGHFNKINADSKGQLQSILIQPQPITTETTINTYIYQNSDYLHALQTAPKGLHWSDDNFTKANFKTAIANRNLKTDPTNVEKYNNNAQIVESTNPDPNTKNTSVIKMTNGNYQVGAIWGNKSQNNYFDLEHDQTASMWLYFGKDSNDVPGDGMAFVLQNDENGENAISIGTKKDGYSEPANGQSMGVWGADWNPSETKTSALSNSAIHNSWALEFDTFRNDLTGDGVSGEGVSFDTYVPNEVGSIDGATVQHIAGNYPNNPQTYQLRKQNDSTGKARNYFTMDHFNNSPAKNNLNNSVNLVDSNWHHLTVKWSQAKSTLSYDYNDKDPVTGIPNSKDKKSASFSIDTTAFNSNDKKLYWGFTGSTGQYSENNLIIFESIPSFVDASATSTIFDDSQNEPISSDSSVEVGDQLTYTYNLNYVGWTKDWKDISAKINIPTNMVFNSGSVYFPKTNNTYNFTSEDFKNPQMVTHKLDESLSPNSRDAVIKLTGKVIKPQPDKLYQVSQAHASFEGDFLITDTNTISFPIIRRNLLLESDTPNPYKIKDYNDINILGKLQYSDDRIINNSSITIFYTLGSNKQESFRLDNNNPANAFKINLNNKKLTGITNISFYAKDNNNNTSNTVTRQLIAGELAFGTVNPYLSFRPTVSTNKKIVSRMGNWFINVIDSRPSSPGWTVQAQSSGLYNKSKPLDGYLIYKGPDGKILPLNAPVSIATHENNKIAKYDSKPIDITKNWTSDNGILLKIGSHNHPGSYTGQITWSLLDTPNL